MPIVVIGSSNVDLIMKMARLPRVGETVTDAEFVQVYGGKGANQAVGAARAGGEVAFVNCVGDDAYTAQMVRNFEADGIDTRYVFHETGIASGHALVMIGEAGANYLSVAPGSNYRLTPDRVDAARELVAGASAVVLQNEIPLESNARALALAAEASVPVLWNVAPAVDVPPELFRVPTLTLVANETEAEFLTGRPVADRAGAEAALADLLALGCGRAVVTLGARGSLARERGGPTVVVDAFDVEAVDTTAAGDVYCGGLAVALGEGMPLPAALRFASAAAALSVQTLGAQPSAPRREAIDALLA